MEDSKRLMGRWKKWGNGWITIVNEYADIVIRPESNLFNIKVSIARSTSSYLEPLSFKLAPCATLEEAMQYSMDWTSEFLRDGPPSAKVVQSNVFLKLRTQCRTHADFLNHIFFSTSNNYDWFNGAIVCISPEDHITSECNLPVGPIEDNEELRPFSHVNTKFSLICHVPDDALHEWVLLAHEAACFLETRSAVGNGALQYMTEVRAQEENRIIGKKIRIDLENRFPFVLSTDEYSQVGVI